VAVMCVFLHLIAKMSEWFLKATYQILCEIRKECKWHLCNALQGSWHKRFKESSDVWLNEAVHRKRLELWPNDWILHCDNGPAHKGLCQAVALPKIDY